MRDDRNIRPVLELLEGKALLSIALPALAGPAPSAEVAAGHESYRANDAGLRFAQSVVAPNGVAIDQIYTVSVQRNALAGPIAAPNYANVTSVFSQELARQISGIGGAPANAGFVIVNGSDDGFIRHESFHRTATGASLDLTFVAPSGNVYLEHYQLNAPRAASLPVSAAVAGFAQSLASHVGGMGS